jgi:hypothetical protein
MPATNDRVPRKRGPRPRPDRGTPSGFRVTDRQRFELAMAAQFLGTRNLQDTIRLAVDELLERMRQVAGFEEALRAAEAHQRNRAGVRSLRDSLPRHE